MEPHGDFLTKYYIDSEEKFARCVGVALNAVRAKDVVVLRISASSGNEARGVIRV